MAKKSTYEELEQRVKELEKEAVERQRAEGALRESEVARFLGVTTSSVNRPANSM